jgi:hypothetical protein
MVRGIARHLIADMAVMSTPTPTPPKADWNLSLLHSLGWVSPSYLDIRRRAAVQGDFGVFLYGSQWTTYKNVQNIVTNAKLAIIKVRAPIMHARRQLDLPFYTDLTYDLHSFA